MKLSSLRYFIAVAKYRSFTKASDRLFISQPTLSRTIFELEEELGTRLFIRERHSLKLTNSGVRLLKEATEIVEKADRLPELFKSLPQSSEKIEVIKIAYQRYFNIQWIYSKLNAFMKEHQDCDIILTQAEVSELKKGIDKGKYDAVFGLIPFFSGIENLTMVPVEKNFLHLVVPENHWLALKKTVTIEELKEETFVLLNRKFSPIVVDYVISRCVQYGFSPNTSYYVDNMDEVLEFVGLQKGISFAHSGMNLEEASKRYHVKFIEINDNDANFDFGLIFKQGKKEAKFIELLDQIKKIE